MRRRHGRVETSGFCLHLGPVGPIENCSGLTLRTFIIVPMGAQVATVPLWSGMVTSQVSTGWSALSPSLKSTVVAGKASAAKLVLGIVTRLPDIRVHGWERPGFSPHDKQSLGLGLPRCFPLS